MKSIFVTYALLLLLPVVVSLLWLEDAIVFLASFAAGVLTFITAAAVTVAVRRNRKLLVGVHLCLDISLGGIASVPRWNWPLRVAFVVSRPALEQAASQLKVGKRVSNQWAGTFFIRRGELRGAIACLWINTDSAGSTGFVQTPPTLLPFNMWSEISLDDRWQLISED